MNIRRARIGDADRIARIHLDVSRASYHTPDLVAQLNAITYEQSAQSWAVALADPQGRIFVATADRRVVGFAAAVIDPAPADAALAVKLDHVYVANGYRDHGIGKRLVQRIARVVAREGLTSMYAWVHLENHGSQHFCEVHLQAPIREDRPDVGMVLFVWPNTLSLRRPGL